MSDDLTAAYLKGYEDGKAASGRERDEARARASEYHRRAQQAEAVIAKGVEDQIGVTGSGSLGRGLANVAANYYRDRALKAEGQRDALKQALKKIASRRSIRGQDIAAQIAVEALAQLREGSEDT